MRGLLVLNPSAGADAADAIEERARRELGDVRAIRLDGDVDLGLAVEDATAHGRIVVAAGGDGTVNAVVQHLIGTEGVLGMLPAGTLNHFARDLGLMDLDDGFAALAGGRTARIDAGRAGERAFVNNLTLGLYPEVVEERERREDRLGRWLALAGAGLRVLRRAQPLDASVSADGDVRAVFAWILYVGNNRVTFAPGRIGERPRLDEGVLDVRVMRASHRTALARASAAWTLLARRAQGGRRFVRTDASSLEVELHGGPRRVAVDGEAGNPVSQLRVEILPGALRVVVPVP